MAETNFMVFHLRKTKSKLGTYCMDVFHFMDLRKLFCFQKDYVYVLVPSISDAGTVCSITDATYNPCTKIFGVKLNMVVTKERTKSPFVTSPFEADFTCDFIKRKNSFFYYALPPVWRDRGS